MDANLLHISYEGLILENPAHVPEEDMWRRGESPKEAPNESEVIELDFRKGDLVTINGEHLGPIGPLDKLSELNTKHGIGRLDTIENRYVGTKSRGCYEMSGGAILLRTRRVIESITLDREATHLKDKLMPKCTSLICNDYWFSSERMMLQALIDESQRHANGKVKLKLYKGNVMVIGREGANNSLFNAAYYTLEEDEVYDQKDVVGFIELSALRFVIAGENGRKF